MTIGWAFVLGASIVLCVQMVHKDLVKADKRLKDEHSTKFKVY